MTSNKIIFKHGKRVTEFYNKHSQDFGMVEWDVSVNKYCLETTNSHFAEASPDHYEKSMKISFSKELNKEPWSKVRNIAVHEWLHGLVAYYHNCSVSCGNSNDSKEFHEELMVNHFTKIIDVLLEDDEE